MNAAVDVYVQFVSQYACRVRLGDAAEMVFAFTPADAEGTTTRLVFRLYRLHLVRRKAKGRGKGKEEGWKEGKGKGGVVAGTVAAFLDRERQRERKQWEAHVEKELKRLFA